MVLSFRQKTNQNHLLLRLETSYCYPYLTSIFGVGKNNNTFFRKAVNVSETSQIFRQPGKAINFI